MADLRTLANWFSSTPSNEELTRFVKVANELAHVAKHFAGKMAVPGLAVASGIPAVSEYRSTKARFSPQVQQARDYYGAQ